MLLSRLLDRTIRVGMLEMIDADVARRNRDPRHGRYPFAFAA